MPVAIREHAADSAELGRETVGFSLQMSTVYLTHLKKIAMFCSREHGISYDDFTILLALTEAPSGEASTDDLCDYLILQRRPVWASCIKLEDRGLIRRQASEYDARFSIASLTDAGKTLADTCATGAQELLRSLFWGTLPSEELHNAIHDATRESLDALRGHPASIRTHVAKGKDVLLDSYVFWRVEVTRWRELARAIGNMSFGGYRVLRCIDEGGIMTPNAVAQVLLMAKSHVSAHRAALVERGYVHQVPNPLDARSLLVETTPLGKRALAPLTSALDEQTRCAHFSTSPSAALVTEAWIFRMHANLKTSGLA